MADEQPDQNENVEAAGDLSRREFVDAVGGRRHRDAAGSASARSCRCRTASK